MICLYSMLILAVWVLDVKMDNLLFGNSLYPSDDDIAHYLQSNPAETEGEVDLPNSDASVKYPLVKAQPIPHGYKWDASAFEAEKMIVYLTDLGHGACAW